MKAFIELKAERLCRGEPRILRVRIDVEPDVRSRTLRFTAKGRIELASSDLTASVKPDAAPPSINLLVEILDQKLRQRPSNPLRQGNMGILRAHAASMALA